MKNFDVQYYKQTEIYKLQAEISGAGNKCCGLRFIKFRVIDESLPALRMDVSDSTTALCKSNAPAFAALYNIEYSPDTFKNKKKNKKY